MPRPTPWRALIGGIRWTHNRRGEALPRPHPAAPSAAHRPEAMPRPHPAPPRPAPPTQSSPREANRPAIAQCAGAKLLGEIGLGVRRPQIAGIGRIGGGRGVPRPYMRQGRRRGEAMPRPESIMPTRWFDGPIDDAGTSGLDARSKGAACVAPTPAAHDRMWTSAFSNSIVSLVSRLW